MANTSEFLKAYRAKKAGQSSSSIASDIKKSRASSGVSAPSSVSSVKAPTSQIAARSKSAMNFGDMGGNATATQTNKGLNLSTGQQYTDRSQVKSQQLDKGLSFFGQQAKQQFAGQGEKLALRNDTIAKNLVAGGSTDQQGIKSYLEGQSGFLDSTPEEQANTIGAIQKRIGEFGGQGLQTQQGQEGQLTGQEGQIGQAGQVPGKTYGGVTSDMNKDFILGANELRGEEQAVFDQLSPAEQRQFEAIGENARKNGQDMAKSQAEYLQKRKAEKEYTMAQREKKEEINAITGQMEKMQSSERIRQAGDQVKNLKQNIAYLGNMGAPGTSSVKMDAVAKQVSDADRQYSQLVSMENMSQDVRDLGKEQDSMQFERQMVQMQDDLDSKVNSSIQNTLSKFQSAEISGEIDTVEELENLRIGLLNNLDKEITGVTDANIKQRDYLIQRYDNIYKEKVQKANNKNIVNQEMSQIQGYYVDGNGDPMISTTTGQIIKMPEQPPMPPTFDKATGNLIQFSTDESGNIVANVDKIMQGSEDYKSVQAKQQQGFKLEQMKYAQQLEELDPINKMKVATAQAELDTKHMENRAKTVESMGTMINSFGGGGQGISATAEATVGQEAGQCGEYVNNMLRGATGGKENRVGNTLESKTRRINAQDPEVGSAIVMSAPGTSVEANGHIGIVTKVNEDGSVEMTSSNYDKKDHVTTVTLPKGDDRIQGYIKPPAGGGQGVAGQQQVNQINQSFVAQGYANPIDTSKGKQLTTTAAADMGLVKGSIPNLLVEVDNLLTSGKQSSGGIGSVLTSGVLPASRGEETKKADATFSRAAQVVGKFLEGGKLAEGDIARYRKMLPSVGDSEALQKQKLEDVKGMILNEYNSKVDGYARNGYNVSKYNYAETFDDLIPGGKKTTNTETDTTQPDTKQTGGIDFGGFDPSKFN